MTTTPSTSRPVALRAARLLDGRGGGVRDATIVVEGGLIIAVGRTTTTAVPAGAAVVDLGDATLLPGLIDAHLHVTFCGTGALVQHVLNDDTDAMYRVGVAACADLLACGITTVRDLGSTGEALYRLVRDVTNDVVPGPDIIASTHQITSADGPNAILGGGAVDLAAACALIDRDVAAGARVVKVIATGSMSDTRTDPTTCVFDDATLTGIVTYAHSLGLRVAAHAHGSAGISQAARCGVDSIEHASFLAHVDCLDLGHLARPQPEPTSATDSHDRLATWPDDATIATITDARPWIVPTLAAATAHSLYGTPTPDSIRGFAHRADAVHRMHQLGLPIVAGTDGGTPGTHHLGLVVEIEQLHAAGLTTDDAIAAATANAAACLGLTDRGVLEPGRRADIIAVPGDPRRRLGHLRSPLLVMQRGDTVHRIAERSTTTDRPE